MIKRECTVFIPGLNEKRRFLVPDNMLFAECIHLMVELLKEEYPESNCKEQELCLFKATTGEILDKNRCLSEVDITDQDELILG